MLIYYSWIKILKTVYITMVTFISNYLIIISENRNYFCKRLYTKPPKHWKGLGCGRLSLAFLFTSIIHHSLTNHHSYKDKKCKQKKQKQNLDILIKQLCLEFCKVCTVMSQYEWMCTMSQFKHLRHW